MPAVREEIFSPMALALVTVTGPHSQIGTDGGSTKGWPSVQNFLKLSALFVEIGTNHNSNILLDIMVDSAKEE